MNNLPPHLEAIVGIAPGGPSDYEPVISLRSSIWKK